MRQTSLSSLIKAELSYWPLCMLHQAADAFHIDIAPSSGLFKELHGLICFPVLSDCFVFIPSDNGVVSDWDLYCCE